MRRIVKATVGGVTKVLDLLDSGMGDATLLWSDEFTGTTLSLATDSGGGTWRTKGYEAGGSVNQGYTDFAGSSWNVSPGQHPTGFPVTVADSVLTITAKRNPGLSGVSNAWIGAYLVTNHLTGLVWRYGYFEWRARLPNSGRGMFPALWLFNNVAGRSDGKEGAELDMLEVFGEADGLPWDMGWHNNPTPGVSGNAGSSSSDVTGWHRYGIEWTSTAITYYRDGVQVGQLTGTNATWFATADMGVRINYAMDPNWLSSGDPNKSTVSDPPTGTELQLQVDYIRVYDKKPTSLPTGSEDPLAPRSYLRGVNLAGPEYGCGNSVETNTGSGAFSYSSIGTYGSDFIYPSAADLSYMATQLGPAPIFRFNVRIERLMTGPGAGFRAAEQARVQALLDNAQTAGAGVILAPWNFGAVWNPTRQPLGSAGFTNAQFADFWSRVVTQWGSHPALIGAELMTEPVGVTSGASGWQTASQAAVNAIRAVNTNLWIWIPNYDYQLHTAATDHPGGPWITDSTGNFGYVGHQYAYNMGGSEYDYANTLSVAVGDGWTASGNTDALHTRELAGISSFKTWVGNHKVYISEYGCPNPGNPLVSSTDAPKWLALWQRLLTEYDANGWWATAWTSGSAVDVADPNEMYCTYYASGGWDTAVNAKSGTAAQTEAHPSVL